MDAKFHANLRYRKIWYQYLAQLMRRYCRSGFGFTQIVSLRFNQKWCVLWVSYPINWLISILFCLFNFIKKMIQFGNQLKGNKYKRYLMVINETDFWMQKTFSLAKRSENEMIHSNTQEYLIFVINLDDHQN